MHNLQSGTSLTTPNTQTKRFAVKFNFIKDLYIKRKVALEHIPSEKQPADAFTKAHGPAMHSRAVQLLRMSRILRFFNLRVSAIFYLTRFI
jgi:hypothetical protein